MNKKLLLTLVVSIFFNVVANAAVTVQQSTETEYLINSGYSELTAEEVHIIKNRVAGKACEPLYEKKSDTNKFVRFLKKTYAYLDPSQETDFKYHHDIKMYPTVTDL